MKLLFDQGTPVPLRKHLLNHIVETAYEKGWSNLTNGDLLTCAEAEGFDALITTDQNLRYTERGHKLSYLKSRESSSRMFRVQALACRQPKGWTLNKSAIYGRAEYISKI